MPPPFSDPIACPYNFLRMLLSPLVDVANQCLFFPMVIVLVRCFLPQTLTLTEERSFYFSFWFSTLIKDYKPCSPYRCARPSNGRVCWILISCLFPPSSPSSHRFAYSHSPIRHAPIMWNWHRCLSSKSLLFDPPFSWTLLLSCSSCSYSRPPLPYPSGIPPLI